MQREMQAKLAKLRSLIREKGWDGLLLNRVENFTWLTCGRYSHVGLGSEFGICTVVVTQESLELIVDEIERYRMFDEEISSEDFECVTLPWIEDKSRFIMDYVGKRVFGSDTIVHGTVFAIEEIRALRESLEPEEIDRARRAGILCANIMDEACHSLLPGMTEYDVAAGVTDRLIRAGAQAPVVLIASDDRVFRYRHPVPRMKQIDKYCMVVIGARVDGLFMCLTRLVHFGEPSGEIRRKLRACVAIDAKVNMATRAGASVKELFSLITCEYANQGYVNEWKLHHQGGPSGYEGRDYYATPYVEKKISMNQMVAWNPSITGVKSEDTIIATCGEPEFLTEIAGWPMIEVEVNGKSILRPDILVRRV